ncbi:hypothetical protein HN51_065239 [Arachis hypogaea]|uniref:LYR motif containing domain-containing protein n=3 Tax=Arachis TaxID=3817 RepID=A0A444ZDM0_ARAHY|nr:uncharacterized protein DS421_14g454150 [Arachis hypogaea]RYR12269.1 hypothetical protein Ahy_B04g069802 [Arachis hypogaea]
MKPKSKWNPPTPSLVSPLTSSVVTLSLSRPHHLITLLVSHSSETEGRRRGLVPLRSLRRRQKQTEPIKQHLLLWVVVVVVFLFRRRLGTSQPAKKMRSGLIWATAEDLAKNRGRVLSLYRQILRSLNSPKLPLTFAARLAKKAEVRAMFWVGSDERSLHNIADLIDAAEYSLSFLKKGELPPRYIT